MRSGQTDLAVRGCRKRSHRQSLPSPASVVVSVLTVGIKGRGVTLLSRGGGLALSTLTIGCLADSSVALQKIFRHVGEECGTLVHRLSSFPLHY